MLITFLSIISVLVFASLIISRDSTPTSTSISTSTSTSTSTSKSISASPPILESIPTPTPTPTPPKPRLFIGVLSSTGPKYVELRKTVRETWKTELPALESKYAVGFKFFLCHDFHNPNVARQQEEEAAKHGDMVILGFPDDYTLIWNKTIALMHYAIHHFDADYVLKVDDDTFISPIDFMQTAEPNLSPNIVGGVIFWISSPIRFPGTKFSVSREEFPDDNYPTYASGTANINGKNIARFIATYARDLPKFKIDDVGVGIWLKEGKTRGLISPAFVDIARFSFYCELEKVANHAQSAEKVRCLWENHIGHSVPCC